MIITVMLFLTTILCSLTSYAQQEQSLSNSGESVHIIKVLFRPPSDKPKRELLKAINAGNYPTIAMLLEQHPSLAHQYIARYYYSHTAAMLLGMAHATRTIPREHLTQLFQKTLARSTHIRDQGGFTALHFAVAASNYHATDIMVNTARSTHLVNAQSNEGDTALHLYLSGPRKSTVVWDFRAQKLCFLSARKTFDPEIVELLINGNADVHLNNNAGKSTLDMIHSPPRPPQGFSRFHQAFCHTAFQWAKTRFPLEMAHTPLDFTVPLRTPQKKCPSFCIIL